MKNSTAPRSFVFRARKVLSTIIQPAVLGLLLAHANAGNTTWTGGGGSNVWGDTNNWGGTNVFTNYGTVIFNAGGAQGTTSVINGNLSQNGLLWTGGSAWTLNNSGGSVLSLFDNGGTQAKIENQSTGLVTINAPINFAANNGGPPNPFGEINAVNGDITFGSGTLTVNGTSVNGLKLFGSNRTTTFNNTVSSSGKWIGLTGASTTMAVGGAFTSGDIYAMNGGTLKLNSGGTITTSALRLGGDFGNTGNQNQALGGTLQFTNLSGGQSFASIINTVTGNTSNALLVDSLNTSGTNTISGNIFLDSALRINQASGGTTSITNATLDLKAQTFTLTGTGGDIGITGVIGNSTGSGQLVVGVNGTAGGPTATLSNANTYSGDTFVRAGTLAFTSAGSAANSTIRLGSTTGSAVDASINLTTVTGGTTISSLLNPVATSGSGTLSLNSQNTSGTNSYTGLIALDRDLTVTQAAGGTLNLSGGNTKDIKANKLIVNTAGTVNISSTLTSSLGAGGILVKQGTGTLVLGSTSNSYTGTNSATLNAGGTQIAGGTLAIAGDTSLGIAPAGAYDNVQFTGTGTLRSDATIALNANRNISIASGATGNFDSNGNTFTINGIVHCSCSIFGKNGAGTVVLTNASNSYTGATNVTQGTLQVNVNNALGTNAAGTVVSSGGALKLNAVSYTTAEALQINGTGVSGGGALVGSGVSSYAGQITAATDSLISAGGGTLTLSGGIVKNGTAVTLYGGPSGGAFNINSAGISGTIGNLIVDNATVGINAASTYNGTTFIRNAGTLNANVAAALPNATRSAFVLDDTGSGNSALSLNSGISQVAASLTGAASSIVGMSSGLTLTVGTSSGSTTFAGNINGSGALVKDGASTQVLSGANASFTGNVTVQGGTLKLDISGSISGSANVTVGGVGSSGAVLDVTTKTGGLTIGGSQTLKGIGQIDGNTTITGTHSPGNSPGLQTFNGNLIYSTGSMLNWELASNAVGTRGTNFDAIDVIGAGVLTIQSGVTSSLIFNALGSTVNFANSFWNSSHSWLVYDDVNAASLASGTVFDTINVSADSLSQTLGTGTFSWQQLANDVYLNFTVTPVPEPTGLITGLLCLAAGSVRRRRRSAV